MKTDKAVKKIEGWVFFLLCLVFSYGFFQTTVQIPWFFL